MIPQVDMFSFIFWKKSKTPKNHFEINWPLVNVKSKVVISEKFVAFSKNLNFMFKIIYTQI